MDGLQAFQEIGFLVLTIAVELPIALVLLRKLDRRRVVLLVLGVNLISHPLIWLALYSYGVNWFAGEAIVALFEASVLVAAFKKDSWTAAGTGIFMNLVTAAIGYYVF